VPEGFWAAVLPPCLAGLACSFLIESVLRPRPAAPWRRPAAALAVHAGVWIAAFAIEMALFRRPVFAAVNVLAIQGVLVLVSNAKYQALREPFVHADFSYFTDALRHPRLYLPFFGVRLALLALAGYGLALWAGLAFEPAVAGPLGIPDGDPGLGKTAPLGRSLAAMAILALAGVLVAAAAGRRLSATYIDAAADLQTLGLTAAAWAYAVAERRPIPPALLQAAPFARDAAARPSPSTPAAPAMSARAPGPGRLPDLVVVQSESFFDVRRYCPLVRHDVLARFDTLRERAALAGRLKVAAWGANTVRTEFAFLSGLAESRLGVHRYNPYRRLAGQAIPTLASYLRALGYRTLCVHPYDGAFYRRHRVFPAMGFDEFVDISGFPGAERSGPYVGDHAVAGRIVSELQRPDRRQPLFVYAITMENHGPLHWETVTDQDARQALSAAMPPGCQDLVAYARHLRNADAMFGRLAHALAASPRPAGLCLFGDHVPIMDEVYRHLGHPDGDTDYLVWTKAEPAGTLRQDLHAHELAPAFLRQMGLLA